MKPVIFISVLIAAVFSGAIGYQMGRQPVGISQQTVTKAERKILYYRNPMGLPDTSPVAKKDSMGMDYVPVYEGDESAGSTIAISPERVQLLGVKTEAVQLRQLTRTIRATATIQASERSLHSVAPRFEGWVRQLQVNTTGQQVAKGQVLLTVYSPDLQNTAREYQLAMKSGMTDLAQSALQRLRNWEVMPESADQVALLGSDNLVLRSPVNGVVLEKMAVAGARFAPGEVLFKLADLSTVWVQAEVAEQDQALVRLGQTVRVTVDAYPGKEFNGKINFISPVLNPQTRTVQVRVELANHEAKLRPGMFASMQLTSEKSSAAVLVVPLSAVIDSGTRQIVLVEKVQGRFEPREIKPGSRNTEFVEVLKGLTEGEKVVVSANFLIDAESNLKAALNTMGQTHSEEVTKAEIETKPASEEAHTAHKPLKAAQPKATVAGHLAQGTLEAINADGTVSITHEPIKSLNWPGMTMDFTLDNPALIQGIVPGSAITFELVERKPGAWIIIKLTAKSAGHPQHEGH
jgi:Cu(I)/Ag(I) efflux system membrane fusion protein